jgi:hypothetical protein
MQPSALRAEDFRLYPPKGKSLALANLQLLQKIPLTLLPTMLRQLIDYDWSFPLEQLALEKQLDYLKAMQPSSFMDLMASFASIHLPDALVASDWVNHPQEFNSQLSAALWSLQKKDIYHDAAVRFQRQIEEATKEALPSIPRFTIVTVGQGAAQARSPLFRSLRPHGVLFTAIDPNNGLQSLLNFLKTRAKSQPLPYAHWYIDGGQPDATFGSYQGITATSYHDLMPVARRELNLTSDFVTRTAANGTGGPEALQSFMTSLNQADLGLDGTTHDPILRHFELGVLTEGAGTQVFSTTFVQWAAREAMRRAQPITMLARFAPRQRLVPMNELLSQDPSIQQTDPEGSLIDADMGAYYTWINQSRLVGSKQSCFLAWHEGQNLALAISPSLPAGTVSDKPASLENVLKWMS